MKLSTFTVVAIVCLAVFCSTNNVFAHEKPSMYVSETVRINAVVEAINHETRVVQLRKSDGEVVTITVGEEARNLDQVIVGDIVNAEYSHSVSIKVLANDGQEAGMGELAGVARAEKGAMPGVAAFDAKVVTATVEAIDLEANTFKLKGPNGVITQYTARNPDNLRRSAVGDLVVITITDSVAISVEEGPAQ